MGEVIATVGGVGRAAAAEFNPESSRTKPTPTDRDMAQTNRRSPRQGEGLIAEVKSEAEERESVRFMRGIRNGHQHRFPTRQFAERAWACSIFVALPQIPNRIRMCVACEDDLEGVWEHLCLKGTVAAAVKGMNGVLLRIKNETGVPSQLGTVAARFWKETRTPTGMH
jgi:hypothetical protein